jgi:hypothetical protein
MCTRNRGADQLPTSISIVCRNPPPVDATVASIFPTLESLAGQAIFLVVGSYLLARDDRQVSGMVN